MDVIYIHSPITYSIARQLVEDGIVHDPLVICGRNIQWDGPCMAVLDDGLWNSERVIALLAQLAAALPPEVAALDVYLPHTAYLFGKLLKLSPLCRRIFYIEEGNTSCDPALAADSGNLRIDQGIFLRLLQHEPAVMQRFGLDQALVYRINAQPAIWFDGEHPKYGGAFRVSDDAFPGMREVRRVTLAPRQALADGERYWLCFLPNIVSLVNATDGPGSQLILHGLVIALRTISALAASSGQQLVIKFHPVDEANLGEDFRDELFRFGLRYHDFCAAHGIDVRLEPALFNFARFIVVNTSAATRYVKLFHGPQALVNVALD